MPLFRNVGLASALIVVTGTSSLAQRCVGTAGFDGGRARISGSAAFTDGAKAYGGSIAVGAPDGVFVSGAYSHTTFDNTDFSLNGVNGTLGYQIPLGQAGQFCPGVGILYNFGSQSANGASLDVSTTAFGLGGAVGFAASSSPEFSIIPSFGFQYLFTNAKADYSVYGYSGSGSSSDSYGVVSIAAGFVFNNAVTLAPTIDIPVGLDGGKASYGVGVGINFGPRK